MEAPRARYLFVCMFSIFLLLNLNFTILRSLRNTLAVVDLGGGAHWIPVFELLGAMPGALFMTWALAKLLNRFSIERVFLAALTLFLGFFMAFSLLIYPFLNTIKQSGHVGHLLLPFFAMLFYAMSELWKPALATILFLGLVNQYVPVLQAKKLYAPLLLGGSLGTMLAGPVISVCTSEVLWGLKSSSSLHWKYSFNALIGIVVALGGITAVLYRMLWKEFTFSGIKREIQNASSTEHHLTSGKFLTCWASPQLRLLSWIVIADYFAYALGEVIFLGVLKMRYPNPSEYCNYMGFLSTWSGVLTFISSLLFAPYILQRHKWVISAMVTPVCLLVTEGMFFFFLCVESKSAVWFRMTNAEWLSVVVGLGALQYCLCRGMKYSFFDASKELSFVLMPEAIRMSGKLIVDGISARLGRGCSSFLSLTLISLSGGVIASALSSGIIAIAFTLSWITSTLKLGGLIDKDGIIVD